eukprot:Clim_evm4s56 gene=Clim_evmTU4s56
MKQTTLVLVLTWCLTWFLGVEGGLINTSSDVTTFLLTVHHSGNIEKDVYIALEAVSPVQGTFAISDYHDILLFRDPTLTGCRAMYDAVPNTMPAVRLGGCSVEKKAKAAIDAGFRIMLLLDESSHSAMKGKADEDTQFPIMPGPEPGLLILVAAYQDSLVIDQLLSKSDNAITVSLDILEKYNPWIESWLPFLGWSFWFIWLCVLSWPLIDVFLRWIARGPLGCIIDFFDRRELLINVVPYPHPEMQPEGLSHCCICLEEFVISEHMYMLPCCHCFHGECLSGWLKGKRLGSDKTCPMCWQQIPTEFSPLLGLSRNISRQASNASNSPGPSQGICIPNRNDPGAGTSTQVAHSAPAGRGQN